ncbi:hypothetical protein N7474_004694 [Penicillium riverlandense]|uniref:uncharacterized protein n=1 Tax=Penicillium riverlandense TaxID=1903569 RepID=UPI002547BB13|nr:uncharacterized protein N7474_004694 [Penicillium riverlandense]KAJ5819103.1 hypothetical protein N7474_004694 [Penicillium riverlandense]
MSHNSGMHGAGQSSVGHAPIYEAGDQRNEPQSVINERERYKEGTQGSHKNLDSKDQRSIANKLASQEGKANPSHHHNEDVNPEAELSKNDPTKPAQIHGNKPSKGAQIDRELQMEDEQRLREKGVKK